MRNPSGRDRRAFAIAAQCRSGKRNRLGADAELRSISEAAGRVPKAYQFNSRAIAASN
jgi:hypothetical protein